MSSSAVSSRRDAREWALRMVFALDQAPVPTEDLPEFFAAFWNDAARPSPQNEDEPQGPPDERARAFAETLARGVAENREAIDAKLEGRMRHWTLGRIGSVERAALRLGAYELAFAADPLPAAVVINEAVDLAKYFGTNESGRFVNGILDALARRERDAAARRREAGQVWSPQDS